MMEFFRAAQDYAFIQYALIASALVSVACGIVGSYVVTRRISFMAGSISHCILGGMGAARYLSVVWGWSWITPLQGAVVAALLAAVVIGLVSLKAKQREDTVIGALWAVGMAMGVLFIAKTPGYGEDLMGYLFGNILMISPRDLALIVGLDVLVVATGILWHRQFLAICFDEEYARLRGVNVEFFYLLLLCLTALTVVLLASVVGIVLVIALLTLPAAVADHFTKTLRGMMALASVCCAAFTIGGLAISYAPNLPAGATVIMLGGVTYLLVATGSVLLHKRQ
jgi:zinc transport system permease protein